MKEINTAEWVGDSVTPVSASPLLGYAVAKHSTETPVSHSVASGVIAATYVNDDQYPGSFFRIPGPPIPGKTTWSIN